MIFEAKRARLPLAMINGRMSERSFKRWRMAPGFIGALLGRFDLCLARSDDDGERLLSLGAPAVLVAGDIKFDAPTLPADRRELAELSGLTSGRQIWIAASTHEGEETIAAEAHKRLTRVFPDALTLIAPAPSRAGRGDPAAARSRRARLRAALARRPAGTGRRRSISATRSASSGSSIAWPASCSSASPFPAGEGRTRSSPPGSPPPSCTGRRSPISPRSIAALDEAGGALEIADPARPRRCAVALFANAARLRAMARAAADAVERRAGAVDRSMKALAPLLPVAGSAR